METEAEPFPIEVEESADEDLQNDSDEIIKIEEADVEENVHVYPKEATVSYRTHASQIFSITIPIVISEIFQNTLPVVDLAFVGMLPDKNDLAAAALATVWFNLWNTAMLGFLTATDTMLAQSFGAKDLQSFAAWTGSSIVVVSFVSIAIVALIAVCEPAMVLFGQDEALAASAGAFSYRLIPGLIPFYISKVLKKYLQTQNIVLPGVCIGFTANVFNVFINWLLIYEVGMGLNGSPWATTMARIVEMVAYVLYIHYRKHELKDTIPSFSRSNLYWGSRIKPFLKLAISGALSFACEAWSFEVTTILAGLINTISLDAHVITLTIANFIFLSFPFAVGIATSIKVGQLIGEGLPADAKRSCLVSYGVSLILQIGLIIALFPCTDIIGDMFSSDEDVSNLAAELLPLSFVFMVADALQANTAGAMRGLGRQELVLLLNILGFWFLAVPVGAAITFATDIGVAGLWYGFMIGLWSTAAIGIVMLRTRIIDWEEEASKAKERISSDFNK